MKTFLIAASRGRNPDNPSDRRPGIYLEQRLEINKDGICNTLTSALKDNYVIEIDKPSKSRINKGYRLYRQAYEVAEETDAEPGDIIDVFHRKRITDGITPTITTRPEGLKTAILVVEEVGREK